MKARCIVAVLCASTFLIACSPPDSPPTLPQGASMDGMFAVELGAVAGVDGKPLAGSSAKQTWAIRTACRDDGCVATVTVLAEGNPAKPPAYATQFDFVDGRWLDVRETTGQCKANGKAPIWVVDSLQPTPGGAIAGTRRQIFANDACASSRAMTLKRVGDANPAVAVADPATTPARTASPAAGFRGRYRDRLVAQATGETNSDIFYDVETFCLRTGEKCLSSFISESRKSNAAYVFTDSKWVTNPTPFAIKCDDGRDGLRTRTGVLTLPDPAQNPLQTLTGTMHSVDVGACPLTLDLDVTIERISDAKPS